MTNAAGISRILTLVFTDLADSTALKTQRGDQEIGELIARHRALVRRLAAESGGHVVMGGAARSTATPPARRDATRRRCP